MTARRGVAVTRAEFNPRPDPRARQRSVHILRLLVTHILNLNHDPNASCLYHSTPAARGRSRCAGVTTFSVPSASLPLSNACSSLWLRHCHRREVGLRPSLPSRSCIWSSLRFCIGTPRPRSRSGWPGGSTFGAGGVEAPDRPGTGGRGSRRSEVEALPRDE